MPKFGYKGKWIIKCFRPDGSLKWAEFINNLITLEGRIHAQDVIFKGGTAYSTHYILLFNSDSTPVSTWEYSEIGTDFDEWVDYDETVRQTWTCGAIDSGDASLTNDASPASFTASTGVDDTLYGAAMVNVNTKGDAVSGVGIEWCATRFSTSRPIVAAEVIKIIYTLNAVDV